MVTTPKSNRIRIAFFGLRNAGKSTLVNAFCGQEVAIVSDTPGTTTDPVSKAMEILPLGPCLITDTAGLDDEGELGEMRVQKTLEVLSTVDIAVWVETSEELRVKNEELWKDRFLEACKQRKVTVFEYKRGDDVEELKKRIAEVKLEEKIPGLLDGLVKPGDHVTCVCPIDSAAPKGRLILPQVQVIRECLDLHATCTVVQPEEFVDDGGLVIVDSQAVSRIKAKHLTTFSVLFARQKGDFAEFLRGVKAIKNLKDGDTVLISEGCTHHRQCGDIGTQKLPNWIRKHTGKELQFTFTSGGEFPEDLSPYALVVHCGGCMLGEVQMHARLARAEACGVPMTNYGIAIAKMHGILERSLEVFPETLKLLK